MTTINPTVLPTYREFYPTEEGTSGYEKLATLIKKYGCPVSKVSDGKDWIRVYFEIPLGVVGSFLTELKK